MILALILAVLSPAQACEQLSSPPETFQVAWVSPLGKRVRQGSFMEVVRVTELRSWVKAHNADPLRLMQGLGLSGRKARTSPEAKVTVFDVRRDWLCRPIADGIPGETKDGVSICEEGQQRPIGGGGKGFTGCGYTMDTKASTKALEVFRVTWEVAASGGFCVMPLERFLEGA